ncbi:MAG TPA: hypothetical protein VM938_12690 [Acidimicrobiales bacterium]|nr:hypothetical protein [Acidimicrobiales bacterium]
MRPTTEDFGAEAEVALMHALDALGLPMAPPDDLADIAVDIGDDRTVGIEVKALSLANPSRVRALVARTGGGAPESRVRLLVADTLTAGAKKLLRDEGWGWFDRRGHVFVRAPGLHVDAEVPAAPRRDADDEREPVAGKAGVAAALALLLRPDEPFGVRATAAAAGLNPSSISRALGRLRDHLLVEPDGRPVVPDLFWVLADRWPRAVVSLKRRPRPEDAAFLEMGDDDLDQPGWALTGAKAAAAWGAPVIAARSPLLEILVPNEAVARRARQRLGEAVTPRAAGSMLRVAPTTMAVGFRHRLAGERMPLAHPAVVALDLAGDLGRGTEILEAWTPPTPFVRVW